MFGPREIRSLKRAAAFTALLLGIFLLSGIVAMLMAYVSQYGPVLGVITLLITVFAIIFVIDYID